MNKFKYLSYVAIAFVVVLMISNTVSSKLISLGDFVLTGAIFLFPITYIFGDILTEVYGYRESRRVIWTGFCALIFMSVCYYAVGLLPPASFWTGQDAYNQILGITPRIVAGSILGFLVGEFCNSYLLAKIKVWMRGRMLFVRTIGSTVVGEFVDSSIFVLVAFFGIIPNAVLLTTILSGYIIKVAIEVVLTPATYKIVRFLKEKEGADVYDTETNFSPLALK